MFREAKRGRADGIWGFGSSALVLSGSGWLAAVGRAFLRSFPGAVRIRRMIGSVLLHVSRMVSLYTRALSFHRP